MILTIHQPEHLPWSGYFHKMNMADVYLLYDDVQYEKNYFQNRNRIMGSNGPQWVHVPVNLSGHTKDKINEITIANESNPKWAKKYVRTLQYSYRKHPYFEHYMPYFETLFNRRHENLCALNIEIIMYFSKLLQIEPKFVLSSSIKREGQKSDQILSICKNMNADTYIAGPSGRDYLNEASFRDAGIKIIYQEYRHPIYQQQKTSEFVPYLSVLDMLFHVGAQQARELIIKG